MTWNTPKTNIDSLCRKWRKVAPAWHKFNIMTQEGQVAAFIHRVMPLWACHKIWKTMKVTQMALKLHHILFRTPLDLIE